MPASVFGTDETELRGVLIAFDGVAPYLADQWRIDHDVDFGGVEEGLCVEVAVS